MNDLWLSYRSSSLGSMFVALNLPTVSIQDLRPGSRSGCSRGQRGRHWVSPGRLLESSLHTEAAPGSVGGRPGASDPPLSAAWVLTRPRKAVLVVDQA
eukprot:357307-Chlamydomonas_euryale.AAC.3